MDLEMLKKMIEEWRKELIEAGEIDPSEELTQQKIQLKYQDYKIKKMRSEIGGRGKSLGTKVPKEEKQKKKKKPSKSESKGERLDDTSPDLESIGDIARRLEESKERGPKPREGLVFAIEQLTKSGKGGNYCMIVVDGCWINFRFKKSKKELFMQVSGDQYIPSKSHFDQQHIKILESFGIQADEYSNDIYSRHFNDKPRDFNEIVTIVFKIFEQVYRVNNKSSAYIEFVLGSKELPVFKEILDGLQDFIPKRDKNKFKWSWES